MNSWENPKEYFWRPHLIQVQSQSFFWSFSKKKGHLFLIIRIIHRALRYRSVWTYKKVVPDNFFLIFSSVSYLCCHRYSRCLQIRVGSLHSQTLRIGSHSDRPTFEPIITKESGFSLFLQLVWLDFLFTQLSPFWDVIIILLRAKNYSIEKEFKKMQTHLAFILISLLNKEQTTFWLKTEIIDL